MHAPKDLTIGVDLGGTKILVGVFDAKFRLLAREKKNTKAALGPLPVVERVAECVRDALAAAAVPHTAVRALGVGVPGMVDTRRGLVRVAPNLHWRDFPFARLLRAKLDVPVIIVNDVEAGTLAVQHFGAGRRLQHFVCMFIGTGIGGGIVIGGQQYRGSAGMGGEIGHMVVVPDDGPKCGCGNRGCLEAVASRSAIVRQLVAAMEDGRKSELHDLCDGDTARIRSRMIAEAYRDGDKLVREVINEASRYIGMGAANLINVLKAAAEHVIGATPDRVRILDSGLGDDAGIIGSALAAAGKR
jgi:glucokinase